MTLLLDVHDVTTEDELVVMYLYWDFTALKVCSCDGVVLSVYPLPSLSAPTYFMSGSYDVHNVRLRSGVTCSFSLGWG